MLLGVSNSEDFILWCSRIGGQTIPYNGFDLRMIAV